MEILYAKYLISSPTLTGCPPPDRPEYAFIGRSNVGKSSLINMLCDSTKLAKTSSAPGKTKLINHFDITSENKKLWYLVDLPGYGFAKVSQAERKRWEKMIEEYIRKRENLVSLFALIDSRLSPQKNDLDFINQLGEWQVPFAIVFTKTDKVTQREAAKNVADFLQTMGQSWEALPPYFTTSALKKTGRKKILEYIQQGNEVFDRHKEEEKF
ncbi:MAG TPA: ribosome biogenesis GTP-binding protein YihA/YsxC [Chitinophagaceae bacterium]|jgi:ribosome biogenesis GTP-binding protein YsxC/EngB